MQVRALHPQVDPEGRQGSSWGLHWVWVPRLPPGVEAEAVEVIEHLVLEELQVFGNPLDEMVLLDEVLEERFETVLEIAVEVEIVVVVDDVTTLVSFEFDQFVLVVVEDAFEPFEVVVVVVVVAAAAVVVVAFEHEVVLDAALPIAVVVVPVVAASFAVVAVVED